MNVEEEAKDFKIPQAKPDSEATQCEYMSLCENGGVCDIEPTRELCMLGQLGMISKDGKVFDPIKKLWRCPKLEDRLREHERKALFKIYSLKERRK